MKLLIVEDHALFRQGLRYVLAGLGDPVVYEAGDCAQALALAAEVKDLDLVLLDIELPGVSGIEGLCDIKAKFPSLPVAMLSASEDEQTIRSVLDQGASGFIPKSTQPPVLLAAIRLILDGGIYIPPLALGNHPVPSIRSAPVSYAATKLEDASPPPYLLTERQLAVLRLLAQGNSNKRIARALNIAEGTIKIHVAAIFRALNVTNRTEAVIAASRIGIETRAVTDITR